MKKSAVSFKQIMMQRDLESDDVLQMAVNGQIRLYVMLIPPQFIDIYEKHERTFEWQKISEEEELTQSVPVAVNAKLCRSIQLDGSVKTSDFYGHSGWDGVRTGSEITVMEDQLFAYVEEIERIGGKIRPKMHGNKKAAYDRNEKIYEVSRKLIEDNPSLFCTKSSKNKEMFKIVSTKLGDYLLSNQRALFGSDDFIGVDRDTLVERILNRDGFGEKKLDRMVEKPD
mgnify:CR=1 FL=1